MQRNRLFKCSVKKFIVHFVIVSFISVRKDWTETLASTCLQENNQLTIELLKSFWRLYWALDDTVATTKSFTTTVSMFRSSTSNSWVHQDNWSEISISFQKLYTYICSLTSILLSWVLAENKIVPRTELTIIYSAFRDITRSRQSEKICISFMIKFNIINLLWPL